MIKITLDDLAELFVAAKVETNWMSIGIYNEDVGLSIWRDDTIVRYQSVEQGETVHKIFMSETAAVIEFIAQLWGSIPQINYEDVCSKLNILMLERLQAELKA